MDCIRLMRREGVLHQLFLFDVDRVGPSCWLLTSQAQQPTFRKDRSVLEFLPTVRLECIRAEIEDWRVEEQAGDSATLLKLMYVI